MKHIIAYLFLFSLLSLGHINIYGLTVNAGQDLTEAGGNYSSITVNANGKVTFSSSVTTGGLTINENGTMIVNGNLDVVTNGAAKLVVDGILIVTGSLKISSNGNSESITVQTNGVLVVGGDYIFDGTKETNSGEVFISDPTDWDNGTVGDLDDLVNADPSPLPDDLLDDFVDALPLIEWDGSTDGDWFEPTNWSNNKVPGASSNVKITNIGAAPVVMDVNKIAVVNNLEISASASLLLRSGAQMTVNGDITNDGELIIENSTTRPASFIYKGTTATDATIKWSYTANRYWYVGQATSELKLSEDIVSKVGSENMLCYTFSANKWVNSESEVTMNAPLDGFVLGFNADTDIAYSGQLNNDVNYSKNLGAGWQLVANPYPAYYDLYFAAEDFKNTTGSIYMRPNNDFTSSYGTYNIASGIGSPAEYDGIIAPNQSFWVQTLNAGSPVVMQQANRIHDNTKTGLKSATRGEVDLLRLQLQNAADADETVIALREAGTYEMTALDSKQRIESGSTVPYIYSLKSGQKSVINVLPQQVDGHHVQLGMKLPATGELTLKVKGLETFNSNLDVYLIDKQKEVSVNLREVSEYAFTAKQTSIHDRFEISFEKPVTTAIGDLMKDKSGLIKVYAQQTSAVIEVDNHHRNEKGVVTVYAMNGQKVKEADIDSNRTEIPLASATAMYIVEVKWGEKVMRQKIAIRP